MRLLIKGVMRVFSRCATQRDGGGVHRTVDATRQSDERGNQNDANQRQEQGVLDHPRTAFVFDKADRNAFNHLVIILAMGPSRSKAGPVAFYRFFRIPIAS